MDKETKLKLAIALSTVFLLVEVFGGYIANSLAIFSDAAHLLTDIAGFGISLLAVVASKRPGCKDYTYGLVRAEVFGALASILSLWVITAVLVYEAYYRGLDWFNGKAEMVDGRLMFFVAIFGVFVNLCLGLVFSSEHGGAFHPAHSHCEHDHDHSSSSHHEQSHKDIESAHGDHGHDHHLHGSHNSKKGNECSSEHDHGHEHGHGGSNLTTSESSSLVKGSKKAGYTEISSHDEDDGHSHAHAPSSSSHAHGHHHDDSCSHKEEEKKGKEQGHLGHEGHHEDFDANIQAAYLHVLTDLIQSIGVALAGLVIWIKPEWQIIDPLCTFFFSILVLSYTTPLIRRIANVLLEGKPPHIDWHVLEERLKAVEGVQDVHDLHVWSISSNTTAMTVHIRAYNPQAVLVKSHAICREMSIQHATIQVQDAAAGNIETCMSESCVGDRNCVVPTIPSYLTGGF